MPYPSEIAVPAMGTRPGARRTSFGALVGYVRVVTMVAPLLLVLFVGGGASAQSTSERLRAGSARHYVLVQPWTAQMRYSLDRPTERETTPLPKLLDVDLPDGSADVRISFRSPFLYSVSVENAMSVDPASEAAVDFIDAVATFPVAFGAAAVDSGELAVVEVVSAEETMTLVPTFHAPVLMTWSLLHHIGGTSCRATGWDALITALQVADTAMYGQAGAARGDSVRSHGDFLAEATSAVRRMGSPYPTGEAFTRGLDSIQAGVRSLGRLQTSASRALGEVEAAVKATTFAEVGECAPYKSSAENSIGVFLRESRARLAERGAALKELVRQDSLASAVAATLETDGERRIAVLAPPQDSVVTTTIVLTPVALSLAEDGLTLVRKEGTAKTLRIRAFERGVLFGEFTAGVAYTDIAYPQWGTAVRDSQTVVVASEPRREAMLPLVAYNLVGAFWRQAPHPVLQVAVANTQDRPAVLAGVGLRIHAFGRTATATVGGVLSWVPDLEGLKEGDPVEGTADIQDALELRFDNKPRLYLSVTVHP